MPEVRLSNKLARRLPFFVIGAMWLWFCGPMMLGMTVVGFRDSAYLYYPMFEAIDMAWAEGNFPLWNPFCNFGMPLVADGTSSVFYPGKLIFACRFLGYPSRYGIYLSTHVLLAATSTYWLARTLRCNRSGATLAAISFAFGGPAIFQVTNVIYLVSAAWLPVALGCVWKFINKPDIRWSIAAAVACAMMILGGDPQMVYHVGLIAAVSIGCHGVNLVRLLWKKSTDRNRNWKSFFGQLFCLFVMVVVTSLLAAIQILPTAELASRSERASTDKIVNFYSAVSAREDSAATFDQNNFAPLLNKADVIVGQYQFSLPPWALLELLAPNVSGKPFPRNARWTNLLPSNDRMWFASLYVGLIVALLAITQIRFWGCNRANVWVSWILLAFLLGSFGWYGAVWAWREIAGAPAGGNLWASPVGGVYWWMSVALPKYFSFRYPAKLFVIASLMIGLLAGRALGPALRSTFTFRLSAGAGMVIAIVALLALVWLGIDGQKLLPPLAANSINAQTMYGPFQAEVAGAHARMALIHSLILTILFVGLFGYFGKSTSGQFAKTNRHQLLGWSLVLLTLIDISIANRWLLAEVPAKVFQRNVAVVEKLDQGEPRPQEFRKPETLILANYFPLTFLTESSDDRLAELVDWQHQSLQARHHMIHKVRLIGSFHSIWPEQYQRFVSSYVDQANRVLSQGDDWQSDPEFLLAEVGEDTVSFAAILADSEVPRMVSAQMATSSIIQKGLGHLLIGKYENITIEKESFDWNEQRFVLQVARSLDDPWIELPVLFDEGWQIKLRHKNGNWKPAVIECTKHDMLGLKLPKATRPGRYEIEMSYRPSRFYSGAIISLVTWLTVCVWLLFLRRRR